MKFRKFTTRRILIVSILGIWFFSASVFHVIANMSSVNGSNSSRHPDAGIWVVYKGKNTADDLQKPYIKGIMAYVPWRELQDTEQHFNWSELDAELDFAINQARKKAFVVVTVGYCPNLDWPEFMKTQIAMHKDKNNQGCQPLQFWDPQYVSLYKDYIRALADHLAEFDANDMNRAQTDILFVRAQVMADTMENLPDDYENWEWQDFNPAPNGNIYRVNLTEEIAHSYKKDIVLTYKSELERAYRQRGLPSPVPATKGGLRWRPVPHQELFVSEGIWFDQHSGSPNSPGWYYGVVKRVRSGETRGTSESGQHWPAEALSQYTYWEILATLHSGVEFIGIYGNNRKNPEIQPKGPVGFAENQEALIFGDTYAGHFRNPSVSPGAWIALRGSYPQARHGDTLSKLEFWTNYEYLITQFRPQDSVLLFSANPPNDNRNYVASVVERKTRQLEDEYSVCLNNHPITECEFLHQKPDKYLGVKNNMHQFIYTPSDLGEVLYCSEDAFCEDRSKATRIETMLWARRTDKQSGHNSMHFDINDEFARSLNGQVIIRLVYLDKGTGKWELRYDSTSNPNNSAIIVQKTNSNIWKEQVIALHDVQFENRQEGGTDITLYNMNDDDDIFHLIEVKRSNGSTSFPEANDIYLPFVIK